MLTDPGLRKTEAEDGNRKLRPTLAMVSLQPSFRRASVLTITHEGFLISHSVRMEHATATEGRITSRRALPGMRHTHSRASGERDGAARERAFERSYSLWGISEMIINRSSFHPTHTWLHFSLILWLKDHAAQLGQATTVPCSLHELACFCIVSGPQWIQVDMLRLK